MESNVSNENKKNRSSLSKSFHLQSISQLSPEQGEHL